jgi:hypothetical protein
MMPLLSFELLDTLRKNRVQLPLFLEQIVFSPSLGGGQQQKEENGEGKEKRKMRVARFARPAAVANGLQRAPRAVFPARMTTPLLPASLSTRRARFSASKPRAEDLNMGAAVLDAVQGTSPPPVDARADGNEEEGFNPQYLSLKGESMPAEEAVREVEAEMLSENPDHARVARLLLHATHLFAVVRINGNGNGGDKSENVGGEGQDPSGFELLMARPSDEPEDGPLTLHLFTSAAGAQEHLDMQGDTGSAGAQIAQIDGISIFAQPTDDGAAGAASFAQVRIDDRLTMSNDEGYLEKLGAAIMLERLAGKLSERANMNSLIGGKMDENNARMLRAMRRFQPYYLAMQRDGGKDESGEDSWSVCSTEDQQQHHYVFAFSFLDHALNFVKNLVDYEADSARLRAVSGAQLFSLLQGNSL